MLNSQFLPIKLVVPKDSDYEVPERGQGGGGKLFGDVDAGVRDKIIQELGQVGSFFGASFVSSPNLAAVAKVSLKPEALAKSHRPTTIFNKNTCPIIGGNRFGQLFVSVNPAGLAKAINQVNSKTKYATANVSAIEEIQPYTERDALKIIDEELISPSFLRVRLFHHDSPIINEALRNEFLRLSEGLDAFEVKYGDGVIAYRVGLASGVDAAAIAAFVGTQSVSFFPRYTIGTAAPRILGNITATCFPPPDPNRSYPVVGMIDSGTDPNNIMLQEWIVGREDRVPRSRQDNNHGSFVAGLIANGRSLNHSHPDFPNSPCRIVDIAALDKIDGISEHELIDTLDFVHARFPDVKVWNLSLGGADPCDIDSFSPIAAALDQRSRDHGVLYIVAAGNYETPPFRSWPPSPHIGNADRISSPGDSVKAITVGSIAHRDSPATRVREREPSPFSRRGPGPAYLTKPEIAHFGGNCSSVGDCSQAGVISLDAAGHVGEDIGTSYATPLITALSGEVYDQLDVSPGATNPAIVKASLVHAAFVANGPQPLPLRNYVGAGCPPGAGEILTCRQSSATIIIQAPLMSTPQFGKRPFPMPECLRRQSNGLRGEIFMTLLYDGPVDARFGAEYCRNNVSASLGTIRLNPNTGKTDYTRQVRPIEVSGSGATEIQLIQNGYKWSPLKLYYRKFSRGDTLLDLDWRLTLELMNRSGHTSVGGQEVVLLITIRAAAPGAPVYDQLVRAMNSLGWGAIDLSVKSRVRLAL